MNKTLQSWPKRSDLDSFTTCMDHILNICYCKMHRSLKLYAVTKRFKTRINNETCYFYIFICIIIMYM